MTLQAIYRQMKQEEEINTRVLDEAHWYLDHKTSVREVADNFCVSKSTVWADFRKRLKHIDYDLYREVEHLLLFNKRTAIEKMNKSNEARRNRR